MYLYGSSSATLNAHVAIARCSATLNGRGLIGPARGKNIGLRIGIAGDSTRSFIQPWLQFRQTTLATYDENRLRWSIGVRSVPTQTFSSRSLLGRARRSQSPKMCSLLRSSSPQKMHVVGYPGGGADQLPFDQRARAAFFAMSLRRLGLSASAR